MRATVEIQFWTEQTFSSIIDTLSKEGWDCVYDEKVVYGYYNQVDPLPDTFRQECSSESWEIVVPDLDSKVEDGYTVLLDMRWNKPNEEPWNNIIYGTFYFTDRRILEAVFDGIRPKLSGLEPFTDFTYYLLHIVQPLIQQDFDIAKIICTDDTA